MNRIDHIPELFYLEWKVRTVEFSEFIINQDWQPLMKPSKYNHLFVDDWRLERFWRKPDKSIFYFINHSVITGPDFSIFPGMNIHCVKWQLFRNRQLCGFWQASGLNVVPVLNWIPGIDESILFEGLPRESVYAVRGPSKSYIDLWIDGAEKAKKYLNPSHVLHFGLKYGFNVWDSATNFKVR